MQPLYNVNYVITCNNTTSTCVSHASFTVLVKNIFPPLKALFHQITLFQSILQTCAFWVPILLARVPIWSPFHWNLGPHRVPILKKVGPHANWEQWVCSMRKDNMDSISVFENSSVTVIWTIEPSYPYMTRSCRKSCQSIWMDFWWWLTVLLK